MVFGSSKASKAQAEARVIGAIDKDQHAKSLGVDQEKEPAVHEFLSKALDHPLPEPWQEHADKKGRIFYWNPAFRQSTWQHPLISTHKALVGAARRVQQAKTPEEKTAAVAAEHEAFQRQGEEELSQWRQSHSDDGTAYYYKIGTQLTRWDNPRDHLLSVMELRQTMLSQLLDAPGGEGGEDVTQDLALAIEDGHHDEAMLGPEGMQGMAAGQTINLGAGVGDFSPEAATNKQMISALKAAAVGSPGALMGGDTVAAASPEPVARQLQFPEGGTAPASPAEAAGVPPPNAVGRTKVPLSPEAMRGAAHLSATRSGFRPQEAYEVPGATMDQTRAVKKMFAEASAAEVAAGRQPLKTMDPTAPDCEVACAGLQPDEFALQIGVDFRNPADKAAFAIVRPLILRPLPAPWQLIRLPSGACGFYHPGAREKETRHPLVTFFAEIFNFLQEHAKTDIPIVEALTKEIFKETSPGEIRKRLGVWQGPLEDTTAGTGMRYGRLVAGYDPTAVTSDTRQDDPRLEASENLMARISAWHHLWVGFAPEEPFPFQEHRLQALCIQLGECVSVMPGAAAAALLAQMTAQRPPAKISDPMTAQEKQVQSQVVGVLGSAYGMGLAAVVEAELAGEAPISPSSRSQAYSEEDFVEEESSDGETDRLQLRLEAGRLEAERRRLEEEERRRKEKAAEMRREAQERLWMQSEDEHSAHVRKVMLEEARRIAEEAERVRREEQARRFALKMNLPSLLDDSLKPIVQELPPLVVKAYGALGESTATKWAGHMLRIYSPSGSRASTASTAQVYGLGQHEQPRCALDEKVWKDNDFTLNSVVKPYVSDLGWLLCKRIGEAQVLALGSPRNSTFDATALQAPPETYLRDLPDIELEPRYAITVGPQPPAGTVAHRAKLAGEAAARRAISGSKTAGEAAEAARQAAKDAGGLIVDVAKASADAAAKTAINNLLPIDEVAAEAFAAARASGACLTECVVAAGDAATMACIAKRMSPQDTAQAAQAAASAAGGSLHDITFAAAKAAATVAINGEVEPEEVGVMVAKAARAAGGLARDVAEAAGEAVAMAGMHAAMSSSDLAEAAAKAVLKAGGNIEDAAKAAGFAAGHAAVLGGKSVEEVGKVAAQAVIHAGGCKAEAARVASYVAAEAAVTAGITGSEAVEQAAEVCEAAGGSKRDVARAAGAAAATVAIAQSISPKKAAKTVRKALQDGGIYVLKDVAKAAGIAAALVARSDGLEPEEVAQIAAKSAKRAGGTCEDVAKIAGAMAAEVAILQGKPVAEVAEVAAAAAQSQSGLRVYVAKAAGQAACTAALARGSSPRKVGQAVEEAILAAGGTKSEAARAVAAAVGKAGVAKGFDAEQITKTVVEVLEGFELSEDEVADAAGAAVGKSFIKAGRSPEESGQAAAEAAKRAGGTEETQFKIAGVIAAKAAITRGEEPADVARRASGAAKKAGADMNQTQQVAGEYAGEAAIAYGRTPKEAGKIAGEMGKLAGANVEDCAIMAGDTYAVAMLPQIASAATTDEQWKENEVKIARRAARFCKQVGGLTEYAQDVAKKAAMNVAKAAGRSENEIDQAGKAAHKAAYQITEYDADTEEEQAASAAAAAAGVAADGEAGGEGTNKQASKQASKHTSKQTNKQTDAEAGAESESTSSSEDDNWHLGQATQQQARRSSVNSEVDDGGDGDYEGGFISPNALHQKQLLAKKKTVDFQSTLFRSTTGFDSLVQERSDRPLTPAWRGPKKIALAASAVIRVQLKKPTATVTKQEQADRDMREDCVPIRGGVACPSSPVRGALSSPPHLEHANDPAEQVGVFRPMPRPLSASAVRDRGDASGQQLDELYKAPVTLARPSSADAKLRTRSHKLDDSKLRSSESGAVAVKRFLNRQCGTIQVAFSKFEQRVSGMIKRDEFIAGLNKFGFSSNCDLNDVFNFLDKRGHEALTLSDLMDHYTGSVHDGLKPYGVGELGSEILYDGIIDCLQDVVSEVMRDLLAEELLNPRGPMGKVPDVKKWLKTREKMEKSKGGRRRAGTGGSDDGLDSLSDGDGSPTSNKSKGKKKKGKKGKASPRSGASGMSGSEMDFSEAESSKGKKKKKGKKGKGGSPARSMNDTASSLQGGNMSGRSTTPKKKKKGKHGSPGRDGRSGASPGRGSSPGGKHDDTNGWKHGSGGKNSKHGGRSQSSTAGDGGRSGRGRGGSNKRTGGSPGRGGRGSPGGGVAGVDRRGGSRGGGSPGKRGGSRGSAGRAGRAGGATGSRAGPGGYPAGSGGGARRGGAGGGQSKFSDHQDRNGVDMDDDYTDSEYEEDEDGNPIRRSCRRDGDVPPERRYRGYEFADDPIQMGAPGELSKAQKQSKLPWVPRPVDHMCRTYSHVFRMINNPGVRRGASGQQKKPVHLSVSVPMGPQYAEGGGSSDEEQPNAGAGESADHAMPLPTGMSRGKAQYSSSPNVAVKVSGKQGLGGAGSTSLPSLQKGAPSAAQKSAMELQVSGVSGIDAESRMRGKSLKGTIA